MNKELVQQVRTKAEGYFDRGEFFCSEAVVHTINELMGWPMPEEITKCASAFPVGLGKAGCLCGAVSGGSLALGIAYGRKHGEPMNKKMFPTSAALHDHIKSKYGSTCCRVLVKNYVFSSAKRKKHCVEITGEVSAWIAEELQKDDSFANKLSMSKEE